LAPAF